MVYFPINIRADGLLFLLDCGQNADPILIVEPFSLGHLAYNDSVIIYLTSGKII